MALCIVDQYQISQTKACKCVLLARSMFFYKHHRRDVYNTPQLLDQKVSDAKLIFRVVLSSILV
jgi:hypothetical protein